MSSVQAGPTKCSDLHSSSVKLPSDSISVSDLRHLALGTAPGLVIKVKLFGQYYVETHGTIAANSGEISLLCAKKLVWIFWW